MKEAILHGVFMSDSVFSDVMAAYEENNDDNQHNQPRDDAVNCQGNGGGIAKESDQ
ncbi:hypothetical protein SDC9_148921 [bioreactor metagenome]|uniref:Uncharacterized protein n=1 Tax=bioreactor metagenome TaxID=1076179 RepID=A0A645EK73_9ZZZZ